MWRFQQSTILQAIALGFECLRRCVDVDRWKLVESGRAVTEFEFLPVNEPRDLWYKCIWKPSKDKERYIKIGLYFSGNMTLIFHIRFLFGLLNIKLAEVEGEIDENTLKSLLASLPILLPSTPGPVAHEDYLTLAVVHRILSLREPNRVVRNVLIRLMKEDKAAWVFVNQVLQKYFNVTLSDINFDERRDLEIRAPFQHRWLRSPHTLGKILRSKRCHHSVCNQSKNHDCQREQSSQGFLICTHPKSQLKSLL